MKHVPRRRLLANFFLLPIYLILLYICSFAIPIHQLIQSSYIINKKMEAYVCPFNLDKTYPLYLMRISCSKVFNHQAVKEKILMAAMTDSLTFWVTFAIFVIVLICSFVDHVLCTIHDDGDDDIDPHIRWDKLMLRFVSKVRCIHWVDM